VPWIILNMKISIKILLFALVALPAIVTIADGGMFARAEDSTTDEDEIEVDAEGPASPDVEQPEEDATEDEEADKKNQGSPDIDLALLFSKPVGDGSELPAGRPVEFAIGIKNSGNRDYIIDGADASFRYPMDYNYHIQNFSAALYGISVKPNQEASVMYSFVPADVFAGRPLGLTINLGYHDADGQDFIEAVFNSTVNIMEVDEGFDLETLFMYLFLLGLLGLVGFLGYQAVDSYVIGGTKKATIKKSSSSSVVPTVEMGSSGEDVDYQWLPDHLKSELKKKVSNGAVRRTSPRLRKP